MRAPRLLSCLLCLLVTAPCAAQTTREDSARSLYEAGRTAFAERRYEDALGRFRESYALSHRPRVLFDMARSAERARREREALNVYRAYVSAEPDGPHAVVARERIALLERRIANRPVQPVGRQIIFEAWFWTVVAILILGAGVGIGAGITLATETRLEDPLVGNTGHVVLTLRWD